MKKVIGIGACVLDTIIEMETYPDEDIKKKAEKVFVSGGGPVSNALVCLSKLGVEAEFLGLLSNDNNGHYLKDEFEKYGVKTSNINFIDNTTAFTSFIVLAKDKGTRTCVFDKGSVPDDPKLLDLSKVLDADVLHLDGNYLNIALDAAKLAKKNGVLVSLDAGSKYPNIESLLPYVDILIPSEDFARKVTGETDIDKAILKLQKEYNPKVLVVTEGAKGGSFAVNNEVKHYNAFKINCVDSNGAGDTFHGAFLAAYLDGKTIEECVRFASATSAIKCQKAGVRTALPNKQQVEAFLQKEGK